MSYPVSPFEYDDDAIPALHEILAALSFALDLTEGAVAGHAIRSCLLAMRLAEAIGMPEDRIGDVYYATLLKDVGCSSNSARMCQIIGGDDVAMKSSVKLVDWARPQRPSFGMVKTLWKQVLPGQPALRKARHLWQMATSDENTTQELIELRCDRGASIVRKIGLNDRIAAGVRHLDEHWDGMGYPSRLRGAAIPLLSRIMLMAQHLDVFCMEKGPAAAIVALEERKGRWFDPELVKVAVALHRSNQLWAHCEPDRRAGEAHAAVLDLAAGERTRLKSSDVDSICEAFADVVDAKSPFTFRHSVGVKNAATAIGTVLGLPEARLRLLRRAALLHDIGKLNVPNSILDKPGRLTQEEFQVVMGHPALSEDILGKVGAFRNMAVVAGQHHEKLDGTGYPHGLRRDQLSLEARVLAVADVYGALSENRPYRGGLGQDEIVSIFRRQVPVELDGACFDALLSALNNPKLAETVKPEPALGSVVAERDSTGTSRDTAVEVPVGAELGWA